MNKFTVNCGVVSRNEPVGFQERKELIKEPVRMSLYKAFQVVGIIKVENPRAATDTKGVPNNIASHIPERQDMIESACQNLQAVQNVIKR